jgi:hypothetical protein
LGILIYAVYSGGCDRLETQYQREANKGCESSKTFRELKSPELHQAWDKRKAESRGNTTDPALGGAESLASSKGNVACQSAESNKMFQNAQSIRTYSPYPRTLIGMSGYGSEHVRYAGMQGAGRSCE